MTLEDLNKIITSSEIASALVIIAFVLVFTVFRRDAEKVEKLRRPNRSK